MLDAAWWSDFLLATHNSMGDPCCTTHANTKVAAQQVRHDCNVVVTTDDIRHADLSGITKHTVSVAS